VLPPVEEHGEVDGERGREARLARFPPCDDPGLAPTLRRRRGAASVTNEERERLSIKRQAEERREQRESRLPRRAVKVWTEEVWVVEDFEDRRLVQAMPSGVSSPPPERPIGASAASNLVRGFASVFFSAKYSSSAFTGFARRLNPKAFQVARERVGQLLALHDHCERGVLLFVDD
jgi:hypothetical protein